MATSYRAQQAVHLLLLVFLHRMTTQSQQKMDEVQQLLRIKSAWGNRTMLAAWNASVGGTHYRWLYVRCDEVRHVW
jgi:hypothetical protein